MLIFHLKIYVLSQLSQHTAVYAQDEDLLVTEFSVVGHTSSGAGGSSSSSISSTIDDISTSSSGFSSSSSSSTTGSASASTELENDNIHSVSTNDNNDISIDGSAGKL